MDEGVQDRLESALESLDLFVKEARLYHLFTQNPHPHIARCLNTEPQAILFIEHLLPLGDSMKRANQTTRYRWVVLRHNLHRTIKWQSEEQVGPRLSARKGLT